MELSFSTVSSVLDSWEKLRVHPNYEETVGIQLFKNFLTLQPNAKLALGLPRDLDITSRGTMEGNRRFAKKASYFMKFFLLMIGKVIDMLGPDMDTVEAILLDLGQRHVRYGVQPEFYVSLGQALMTTLEANLKPQDFNEKTKAAWVEVYAALSHSMILGHNQLLKETTG
eukprot:CAMPEP_0113647460 /NCGR_PEP_ID=MMETSP0017_2-20120614/25120_1 /TAXON_ID=2856 /ORGANISM="Cylindrotheca closterium" /LENGTH=169 /DNA_ID=CAMNT_0000559513 /DNA_START=173 /DNA_END=682 /DNA_ORIENTATION=+ /assembly_acc=CAM_ASM_000147